jgi:hypothetical protein
LEVTYRIPRAQKSDKEELQVLGSSLFTSIFLRYNSKDSLEEMEGVQQKLFSEISAACRKLLRMPVELAADNVRQNPSFGSDSSLPSSTLYSPPPTSINLGSPGEADDRARCHSSPPSEYRPVTPSTEISQISYEHTTQPQQTPPRPTQPQQTPPRPTQPTSPTPPDSPNCKKCHRPTVYKVTKMNNPNGNAERPYFRCDDCSKFHSFADSQGIYPQNPHCRCGQPSRFEQASIEKGKFPFYVCATGVCDFYREPNSRYNSRQSQAPTSPITSPIPEMQGMSLRSED